MAQPFVRPHGWRLAAGIALSLVGAAILAVLVYVFNCGGEACERAMIGMGLAWSALVAVAGQFALIVGLRLIWTAVRDEA